MSNYSVLTKVKDFESLIDYLRDELDWNFQAEDIEDLTFDYEPEELGLDEATSANIDSIKQLRPLTNNQSWGIFYIDFEPKKLPIVALRRILSKLVVKRRISANQSDRAAWQMHDLLFLSSYGENRTRTMSFAHFSDNSEFGDLPTLKTITWNNLDTPLHLQHAHDTLQTKLRFPDNPNDSKAWREQWSSAFTQRHGEVIRTSKQLAVRLAELAKSIRRQANEILHLESEKGELRKLHKAFQEALIHDLSYDDFADMYAQTISYGLLTAKISRPAGLVADNVADMIPVTNPFLKELLQTFLVVGGRGKLIDFDELGINDVVEMLRKGDMEAVLRDFGDRNPTEDPAIHFYEHFLREYDSEKRMKRGVFYTPLPVVSFIVRSVHEILQKEFNLPDGLGDTTTWGEMKSRNKDLEIPEGVKETAPFVQILDPATGTGTFLVEVIEQIHKTLEEKWQREGKSKAEQIESWNEYVPKNLLPRLYGFELMMAPYSIAHMKIGLKLSETGYLFLSSERAQIYLTNTLEESKDFSDYFATMSPALAHEAEAANRVKRQTPITVVVGNPPYANFGMLNKNDWITSLLNDYKKDLNERKLNLDDDFIKFIKYSQSLLEKSQISILGFITNSTYIDGITHRRMRESLINTFSKIQIVDLHGSGRKAEKSPDGSKDENVFEIIQGVSIGIFIKTPYQKVESEVYYSEIWGSRNFKYDKLAQDFKFLSNNLLIPQKPYFFFVNRNNSFEEEYKKYFSLNKLLPQGTSAVQTKRDELFVDFESSKLEVRMSELLNGHISLTELSKKYPLDSTSGWSAAKLNGIKYSQKNVRSYLYRPFDFRSIYYDDEILGRSRIKVFHNLLRNNLALVTLRQTVDDGFRHIFCTKLICDINLVIGHHVSDRVFPLYIYPTENERAFGATERVPNFSDEFVEEFSNKLGLEFVYDEKASNPSKWLDNNGNPIFYTPEDVFAYAYAVFHSPTYRARYADFLKIDFPRLPLTTDTELFRKLCALGARLVALHLLESVTAPPDWRLHTEGASLFQNTTVAAGFPKKELADMDENGKGKVYINKTTYFDGVPLEVFEFHIGGYQVCHKWLKDRKERALSEEDINHYGKIIVALGETIRLMAEIDETIEEHGSFPLVGSLNT
jgi:hypothetical protein